MIFGFALFFAAVVLSLVLGWSVVWPLGFGLCLFFCLGLGRGYSAGALGAMAWKKGRAALGMLWIFLLIGMLTAMWRSCGAIAFCIVYGVRAITPPLFLLVSFLLTAGLSFALGTSFGVTGTAGVILMALARSGGVDPTLTAGVILSGAYFGDRCSPASSCAALVASATGTRLYDNVRLMLKTGALPTALTLGVYALWSMQNPIREVEGAVLDALSSGFALPLLVLLPVALMLVLPLLRVEIRLSMAASIAAAFLLTVFLQDLPLGETLRAMVLGYAPAETSLAAVLGGGGLVSMLSSVFIVLFSSLYSGILEGTKLLEPVKERIDGLAKRLGLFPTCALVSAAAVAIFCNQSVMVLLDEQLLGRCYESRGASRTELAMDMANSGVTIAGLVPWSVAVSIPLAMLGESAAAIPCAVLLYAIPLCYFFTKSWFRAALKPPAALEKREEFCS